MKTSKKFLSFAIALSVSALAVTALRGNAIRDYEKIGSEAYNKVFESFEAFDDNGFFSKQLLHSGNTYQVYYNEKGFTPILIEEKIKPHFEIVFSGADNKENKGIIEELVGNVYKVSGYVDLTDDTYNVTIFADNYECETTGYIKELFENIKKIGEVKRFDYITEKVNFSHGSCSILTYSNSKIDTVKAYLKEKAPDISITENTVDFIVDDEDKMTLGEKFALMVQMGNDIGISPDYYFLASNKNTEFITNIDVLNSVNSDANCDDIVSMADAASIFQAIGNPDKYALSNQGEFNADYAGDGLTPDDAIAIQKKLAGIV